MIDTAYLKQIFNEKLAQTGSFDDAFTKAVWVAFQEGIKDAKRLYECQDRMKVEEKQS